MIAAVPAVARALPPATAADHTAVYRQTTKMTVDGKAETRTRTLTIIVAGGKSRWQEPDGRTVLFEREKLVQISWGGVLDEQNKDVALQEKLEAPRPDWEFGYARIASEGPPREAGAATVAGAKCTVLKFESKRFGSPELCVTEQGIVARLVIEDPAAGKHVAIEAQRISLGTAGPMMFTIPKDRTLYE